MILNAKLKSMLLAICLLIGANTQAGLVCGAVAYWATKAACYVAGTAVVITAAPTVGAAVAAAATVAPTVTAAIGTIETASLVVGGFFTMIPFLP